MKILKQDCDCVCETDTLSVGYSTGPDREAVPFETEMDSIETVKVNGRQMLPIEEALDLMNKHHQNREWWEGRSTTQSKFIAFFTLSTLIITLGVMSYLVHVGHEVHDLLEIGREMQTETLHTLDPVRYSTSAQSLRANLREGIEAVNWQDLAIK